ncbi:hypothetical protein [Rivibacter subsaxonicus]|uniref:hypothetical protein n=1 Tax=Rivibacter subsaxonicus TaxID=457575 RepID=UPI001A92460D|nr:hypothetical protein [Rivibacter subsaxonicus]
MRSNCVLPWAAHLSTAEIGRPGGYILAAVRAEIERRGLARHELPTHIGITATHFGKLRSGTSPIKHVSAPVARRFAKFLGLSLYEVLIGLGQIEPIETLAEQQADEWLHRGLDAISRDRSLGPLPAADLESTPRAVKVALVHLHQLASSVPHQSLAQALCATEEP